MYTGGLLKCGAGDGLITDDTMGGGGECCLNGLNLYWGGGGGGGGVLDRFLMLISRGITLSSETTEELLLGELVSIRLSDVESSDCKEFCLFKLRAASKATM